MHNFCISVKNASHLPLALHADLGEVWLGDGDGVPDDDALALGEVVQVHGQTPAGAVSKAEGAGEKIRTLLNLLIRLD